MKAKQTTSLQDLKDEFIGPVGTKARDHYELELSMEVVGDLIKNVRKEKKLTQEQLGKLVGVQKAQISKLERNAKNVTIETLLKVFNALSAKVKLSIDVEKAF